MYEISKGFSKVNSKTCHEAIINYNDTYTKIRNKWRSLKEKMENNKVKHFFFFEISEYRKLKLDKVGGPFLVFSEIYPDKFPKSEALVLSYEYANQETINKINALINISDEDYIYVNDELAKFINKWL